MTDLPPAARPPRVVIIGAGFGGLYAARALRRAPVDITVIDRRNHHLFQPLLYQVATAALSPGDIAYPIRAVLSRQKNARVLLAEVFAIDLKNRKAVLKDGEVEYDYLIIATGASHSYFGHDEWEPSAPGLKTLEDALEIRRRILYAFERAERETDAERRKALLTFMVVGGGPTGVELAGAIAEISRHVLQHDFRAINPREARVILVEAGPRILSNYPPELSGKASASLERLGAEVWTNSPVTSITPERVVVANREVPCATTLWAAGVQASPLAQSLGIPLDKAGRVIVEPDLSIPGFPEVIVIGDLAVFTYQTGKPLPGVAPVAIQQGRHSARNILRSIRGKPRKSFHYFDKGMLATIGRAAAVADFGFVRISGFFAWLAYLFVHIFFLIGFRNRFVVMFEWAWAYFTFQRGARLITGDIDKINPPADANKQ
ncbi:MAG TPA: NAD(P)/FAD-dependent oxidoreductase [Terriglobia bacterium]|nr:NAD(P)/FAD-dependent oxidoreductase [Terriglobia bacterium]